MHSIEYPWCSFGNSKTLSFQQLSVNLVILKIHPQWLRQAQPPILLLHDAWASRRQHQKNLITSSPHHQEKFHTQWLRQAQPPILPLHGAWACRRHIISIALKIRVLSRTSLMFLWELKNAIISTKSPWTLCYRNSKTKQKNSTHGGFDKLSHQIGRASCRERV